MSANVCGVTTLRFVTKQEERILDADKREQALKRLKQLNKK